ncbi:MAG: hypothetical protein ACLSA6_00270 [Holdemania massiliensis]
MYEVKRQKPSRNKRNSQQSGNELIISVTINPMAIARKHLLNWSKLEICRKAKANPGDIRLVGELGDATQRMLDTILGVDNTQNLMRFYEDDMLAMVMDVMPFVLEVLYPKILASSKEAAKRTRRRHFLFQ